MFHKLPKATSNKLWKHQIEAMDFAIKHLNDFDSPCLIRMPTGAGKTGIIACLTRLSNQGFSNFFTNELLPSISFVPRLLNTASYTSRFSFNVTVTLSMILRLQGPNH